MDKFDILKPKLPYSDQSKEYALSKINYIKSRDHVLFQYAQLVRNFFIVAFPILLYYIKIMVIGHENNLVTWILFIAFGIASSYFWCQYFNKDVNNYQSEIEQHNAQINKLLASN